MDTGGQGCEGCGWRFGSETRRVEGTVKEQAGATSGGAFYAMPSPLTSSCTAENLKQCEDRIRVMLKVSV